MDEVKTTSETRANLTQLIAEFRRQGKAAQPIMFGSHRKAEAVLMPAWMWKRMADEIDDLKQNLQVLQRMQTSQVGDSPDSPHIFELLERRIEELEKLDK